MNRLEPHPATHPTRVKDDHGVGGGQVDAQAAGARGQHEQELVAAGALPEDKLLDFIPLPSGQIRVDGTFDPQPDSKMDMIARQQDMIASQKAFGLKTEYTTMVLKLYKNFQALHDQV